MSCSNEIFIQIKEYFIRSTNYGIMTKCLYRYNVKSIYIAKGKEISHMHVFGIRYGCILPRIY